MVELETTEEGFGWDAQTQKTDQAEDFRIQHREIVHKLDSLESSRDEVKLLDDEQCKSMFGLGAFFGRKKYLDSLKDIDTDIGMYRRNYTSNITNVRREIQAIREGADARQYLISHSAIDRDEAEQLSSQEISDELNAHFKLIEIKHGEAKKINDYIRAGHITLEQAESDNVDEYIDRVDTELKRHKEKKYNLKEDMKPINLCFARRTNNLPEVESGNAFVRTPFNQIEDPMNPHLARVSSHWAVNHVAPDPGPYGAYGTNVTIICEGDKFFDENGLPKRIDYDDIYWLHDIALPKGTKVYLKSDTANAEQIELFKQAGLEIHILTGEEPPEYFNDEILGWGYSDAEVHSGLRRYAGNIDADLYGLHQDEEADIAVKQVSKMVIAIRKAEEEQTDASRQSAIEVFENGLEEIYKTIGKNISFKDQISKIERLLGPVIEDLRQKKIA